jgi:hypothetical protein
MQSSGIFWQKSYLLFTKPTKANSLQTAEAYGPRMMQKRPRKLFSPIRKNRAISFQQLKDYIFNSFKSMQLNFEKVTISHCYDKF